MHPANWTALERKIIQPGIEKHLLPLLMYRGHQSLGRIHRLWNFAITCMEQNVSTYSQAVKLSHNPDFAHLCGPERPVQMFSMYGLFGRLIDNPKVTNNIGGLTEFVRDIRGLKFTPTPVAQHIRNFEVGHTDRYAPWRIVRVRSNKPDGTEIKAGDESVFVCDGHYELTIQQILDNPAWRELKLLRPERSRAPRAKRLHEAKPRRVEVFYPYIIHNPSTPRDGADLVMAVNAMVPSTLPDYLRADICQDMIVSVLSGEIPRDGLRDATGDFIRRVMKLHPTKYGPLPLDVPLTEGGLPLSEMISDGSFEQQQGEIDDAAA